MAILVACLGTDDGSRKHVKKVIEDEEWEKVIIIGPAEAQAGFMCAHEIRWISIDQKLILVDLKRAIKENLTGSIGFGDVGVNIMSGTGKEHMATLSALLELGAGIRFVALTPEGVKEI
jgi:hypothetical protein